MSFSPGVSPLETQSLCTNKCVYSLYCTCVCLRTCLQCEYRVCLSPSQEHDNLQIVLTFFTGVFFFLHHFSSSRLSFHSSPYVSFLALKRLVFLFKGPLVCLSSSLKLRLTLTSARLHFFSSPCITVYLSASLTSCFFCSLPPPPIISQCHCVTLS